MWEIFRMSSNTLHTHTHDPNDPFRLQFNKIFLIWRKWCSKCANVCKVANGLCFGDATPLSPWHRRPYIWNGFSVTHKIQLITRPVDKVHANVTWLATPHRDYVSAQITVRTSHTLCACGAPSRALNKSAFAVRRWQATRFRLAAKTQSAACIVHACFAYNNYEDTCEFPGCTHGLVCLVVCPCCLAGASYTLALSLCGQCENSHCIWQRFACFCRPKNNEHGRSCCAMPLLSIIKYFGLSAAFFTAVVATHRGSSPKSFGCIDVGQIHKLHSCERIVDGQRRRRCQTEANTPYLFCDKQVDGNHLTRLSFVL